MEYNQPVIKPNNPVFQTITNPQRKKLEIVVISDTHGDYTQLNKISKNMKGDIFIHAGDFTYYGVQQHFLKFFKYLQGLNFRYKIVIGGNHEISLDNGCISNKQKQAYLNNYNCNLTRDQIIHQLKLRCIYLEHQLVQIEGIKIFGSPYTPYFVGNAFQYRKSDQNVIWSAIPNNIDLLVTHCPPFGILDLNAQHHPSGSKKLRQISFDRKPKYHIFGHIHESNGMNKIEGITFLNVALKPTRIII